MRILKNLFLIAILFATACSVRPEVTPDDHAIVALVEHTWRGHQMPDPGECLDNIGVVQISREMYVKTCGGSPWFKPGCVLPRRAGSFDSGSVIYLSPHVQPNRRREAVAHMTIHTLVACTSKEISDRTDEAHFTDRAWIQSSGVISIESFVRDELE